jgi:hypothetical protein
MVVVILKRKVWENSCSLPAALSCYNDNEQPFLCPITGYLCGDEFSHLCEHYGCVRQGSLSAVMRGGAAA